MSLLNSARKRVFVTGGRFCCHTPAQELTGRSYPASRAAVLALEEAGILRQNAKNRKSGIYVADDVMRAFNAYEGSLAAVSGDTSAQRPLRSVPQRPPGSGRQN